VSDVFVIVITLIIILILAGGKEKKNESLGIGSLLGVAWPLAPHLTPAPSRNTHPLAYSSFSISTLPRPSSHLE
jgi:hypothetical protein